MLLCHGLGANRYNLDAPGQLSLARWLCKQGFDCWVIELRGAGDSSRPRLTNRLRYNWTFDDYVNHDLPAALAEIRKQTGEEQVHWVGHSMGGMLGYAYLIRQNPSQVRSLTAIASPSFSKLGNRLFDRIVGFRKLVEKLPKLPYQHTGVFLVPGMPLFKETFGRLFGNPRNLSTTALMKLVVLAPTDLPTTLLSQLADWYSEDGGFRDAYGNINYCSELHRIQAPALVLAGAGDQLTPPEDLEFVFDRLGSPDKEFMLLGQNMGCRHDYGHIDLVLGKHAPSEVWPHILNWISEH